MTGVTTGTPAYMAPEQVTGGRVGPASDRYSLATIAYEMLTGVIPFDGEGLMEILYAQVHRDPPPPSSRDSSLGPGVDTVILRGLAKAPEARWESAGAFVEALEGALAPEAARSVEATVVMAVPTATTTAASETALLERVEAPAEPQIFTLAYPSPPPTRVQRRLRRRTIGLVAAAVIVALLAAGVVGWAATHRPVTFSLSTTTVTGGDRVAVSADHLPPNQAGRVELWSARYTFPFRAEANGRVELSFVVPVDIEPGDHLLKLCWNGSCREQQTLHVLAPAVATPTPSPAASPSPRPSSAPSAVSSPSVSPNPRTLALSAATIKVGTGTLTAKGSSFSPGKAATVTFVQQATATNAELGAIVVGSTGVFYINFQIPNTARPGPAYIVACDPVACAYAGVNVIGTT